MKPSERLAELLRAAAQKRFQLKQAPEVRVVVGAGLGHGIKFRVVVQKPDGCDFGLTESHHSVKDMLAAAKGGRELYLDHNGNNHTVSFR